MDLGDYPISLNVATTQATTHGPLVRVVNSTNFVICFILCPISFKSYELSKGWVSKWSYAAHSHVGHDSPTKILPTMHCIFCCPYQTTEHKWGPFFTFYGSNLSLSFRVVVMTNLKSMQLLTPIQIDHQRSFQIWCNGFLTENFNQIQ